MSKSVSYPVSKPEVSASCSIASTLGVIGDRWSLLILRNVFRGSHRFNVLQNELGIAKNLLSDRLSALIDANVLERVQYQGRPPRFEYRLTAKGADLSASLIALMKWGDRWYAADEPPIVLVHRSCHTPLDLLVSCPRCNETVPPGQVRSAASDSPANVHSPDEQPNEQVIKQVIKQVNKVVNL